MKTGDSEWLADLKNYAGPPLKFMEICGTHTATIERSGIRGIVSNNIKLVSGPGCPVCVTVTAYLDRLIELTADQKNVIVSFGDLLRVPGSMGSLSAAKADGADVRMVYSPFDILPLARAERERQFIFAAVGFETTAPLYALLIKNLIDEGMDNVKLLTSLKTMPEVSVRISSMESGIDGYLAPGHVCAVAGYSIFEPVAARFSVPFVVSGFSPQQILISLSALLKLKGQGVVKNFYPSAVTAFGNTKAREMLEYYFEKGDASWRGLGRIENSGLYLKEEFAAFDAGSRYLTEDREPEGCCCSSVITGEADPASCPLFSSACTPGQPVGACMVSQEGACFNRFR